MRLEKRKIASCVVAAVFGLLMAGFSGNTNETEVQAKAALDTKQIETAGSFEEAWTSLHKTADVDGMSRTFEEAARKRAEEEAAARKLAEAKAAKEAARRAALEKEKELLAALIYCEAGGEPYEGQVAVGAVVLNRVRSANFPNSISGVIYDKGQFGPAITGKLGRVLANGKTTESCRQAAADALAGVNPIGEALYFGNGNYGQKIGGHWFH